MKHLSLFAPACPTEAGSLKTNQVASYLAGPFIMLLVLCSSALNAQPADEQASITGSWRGTLIIGRDEFDMTFNFSQQNDGYTAALISRQLGIYGMPAERVTVENNRLTIRLDLLGAEYTGRLRMDDSGARVDYIDGSWFQEGELVPIILRPVDNQ